MDIIKELEAHKLDPAKLTLESLTAVLPCSFKSQKSEAVYRWVCIPSLNEWCVVIYLCRPGKSTIHRSFIYPKLATSICHMLSWLLDEEIISYHQIVELL